MRFRLNVLLTLLMFSVLVLQNGWAGELPNIIFILSDDMGPGDMGCVGHPYIKTPNLDRLASEGTLFTQFYANNPVCSPSRAAFMTGCYPAETGVHCQIANQAEINAERGVVNWLDPKLPNLANQLKKNGYVTAHFGKWHLGAKKGPVPAEYGFDVYRPYETPVSSGYADYPSPKEDPFYRAHSSQWFVEDALEFIRQHKDSDKPFFINLWTLIPHGLLKPTQEELKEYAGLQVNPNDFSGHMVDYLAQAKNPTSQMQVYCAAVTGMDNALGYFLDQLKELGLQENTIILFSSDNGPEDYHLEGRAANAGVGDPGEGRGRKRSLYQGGVRVPCILRWPGHVPAGRVDSSVAWSAVDFLPTLLSVIGADDVPSTLNGEDVSAAWVGKDFSRTRPLFWEWRYSIVGQLDYMSPTLAVQDGRWRAYVNGDGTQLELYDIQADFAETNNLALSYVETAERLKADMLKWKATLP